MAGGKELIGQSALAYTLRVKKIMPDFAAGHEQSRLNPARTCFGGPFHARTKIYPIFPLSRGTGTDGMPELQTSHIRHMSDSIL